MRQSRRTWQHARYWRVVALLLCTVGWGAGYWKNAAAQAKGQGATSVPLAAPYTPSLVGKVVSVELSGFEPDFDPIRRVIISASLRDQRTARPLPDTMLVLSSYVELFQQGTIPVLPDLLHPDQIATSLGGFMQGKAALVNASGKMVYSGSLVGEIFLNNLVYVQLALSPTHGGLTAPTVRIKGSFLLDKDLSVHGSLQSPTGGQLSGLAVSVKAAVPWQRVVDGLTVRLPAMVGTSSGGRGTAPVLRSALNQTPTTSVPTPANPPRILYFAGAAVLVGLGVLLLWAPWQRKVAATQTSDENGPPPSPSVGVPDPQ